MLQPKVHTTTSRLNNTGLHPDKWQGYPLTGQPFFAPLPHFSMGQLQDLSKLEQPTAAATAYELVSDPAHLEEVVQEYLATSTVLAVDTETTGLDPLTAQLLLVQIATPNKCFIFDATRLPSLAPLKPVLENPHILKLLQNAKFDYKMLKQAEAAAGVGDDGGGIELCNIYDTYLAERLLTCGQSRETNFALETLAQQYTGLALDKSVRLSFYAGRMGGGTGESSNDNSTDVNAGLTESEANQYVNIPSKRHPIRLTEAQLQYAARDVMVLFPIYAAQLEALKRDGLLPTLHLECECIGAVGDMELAGVKLDAAGWRETLKWARGKRNELEAEIMAMFPGGIPQQLAFPGFGLSPTANQGGESGEGGGNYLLNLNSSSQVLKAFSTLGINYIRGTSERELGKYENRHPVIAKLIEYRGYEKMLSAFGENILGRISPRTGRVHPDFLQLGADTGRFSCTNPNLQQIPTSSRFRQCFVAEPGYKLVVADYRQAELAILAVVSNDEGLLEAFRSRQDLHALAAARMFAVPLAEVTKGQRAAGKAINFGIAYGMSAASLGKRLGKTTQEAEGLMAAYFRSFPKIKGWLDNVGRFAQRNGYNLTPIGRRRYYRQVSADDIGDDEYQLRQFRISRRAKSSFMQGGNADITKLALIFLKERLTGSAGGSIGGEGSSSDNRKYDARVVNTVHDEIVVEVRTDQAEIVREIVRDEMERAGEVILGQKVIGADVVVSACWSK